MSKNINIGQPLFNNIEGHPFLLGPQGPYSTKEEARRALIVFYESVNDIPNGQECIIAGVRFVWRDNDLYENLAVKVINENKTDLNSYTTPGTYRFNSIRNNNFANLPISNNNPNASITGELAVYNSVEGTTTYRSIIGQVLFLSNAEGHETKIYTRSANKTSKDGGVTYEVTWGDWQVCQGMKEVGVVNSYDSFIDNGMYSGIYNNNGIIETFIVITINDYVTKSQLGAPKSVSQLKYALNTFNNESKLSVRVGGGQEFKWDEWKVYFNEENIIAQITKLQNQLNSLINIKADKTEVDKKLAELKEETNEAINDINPVVINGDVINTPDEEDLTTDKDNKLKFKDRNSLNGIGHIILRKNKTFSEQLTQINTIYEIRYDFDLNDEEITIPTGCVLDFQGGSLNNGSVVGNNTYIRADIHKIFNLNLNLKGKFNIPYIYSEWYGAIGDGVNDDSFAINKALSTPIITLRLLDKKYNVLNTIDVVYNVDNSTKKANIVVPDNKIIIGTSTSDYTNNSTISVSENADSDFGLFILGRQVKLENIRVISNKNDNGIYSCDSLIVTQKGVSHLTFNQVYARFCNKNAMDIDGYGLIFNLCSAGSCGEVAYYLHGTSGNNTSATLISCAAGAAKSHGYLLHKMTYCTLVSCSADFCGHDSESLDINNIQHAYHITECRFISMTGCGCEGCYKAIKTSRDTRGLNVTACDFLLFEESNYPEGFDYSDIISLDFTEASRFVNTNIGRRFSTNNLITATNSAKVVFEDCFLQKANASEKGGLLNRSNIKYIHGVGDSEIYKNIIITNNIGFVNIKGYSQNVSTYNNTTIYDSVTVQIGDNEIANVQYENINGKIILTSKTDKSVCSIISNNTIKNCTDFTLRNLTLNFNNFSGDLGFVIDNSVVIFDNVSFISYHSFTTKKLLSVINSKIIFKNCKTTPGYNSSKFIKDVMTIDNTSIIEFIDKDCGTTEERNAFTPLFKGFVWFDTNLSKPIYYDGSKWVDATGTKV